MLRRLFRLVAIVLAVVLVVDAAVLGFAWFVSNRIMRAPWYELRTPEQGLLPREGKTDPRTDYGLAYEDVAFPTADGSTLRGWYVPAPAPTDVVLVTAHGGGTDRRSYLDETPWLHEAGYPVLLFDYREHGISDGTGRGLSLGVREHEDVLAAVRFVREAHGFERVGVLGSSLGGVSAILAASRSLDIDAVVAQGAGSNLVTLLQKAAPVLPGWFCELTARLFFWRVGAPRETVLTLRPAPLDVIDEISPRPLLLIHGTDDEMAPFAEAQAMYSAAGEPKELWAVEGARHTNLTRVAGQDAYRARILRFLREHLPLRAPARTDAEREYWFERRRPEEVGWSPERLERVVEHARSAGTTAGMVVAKGAVVASWGDVSLPINSHSVRKSLLSALYGTAVSDGEIRLDATLEDLAIDDEQGLSAEEKQARVELLLNARSGVYHPAGYETPNMKRLRPERGSREPGAHWYYNNWDFNALGSIFEQATGTTIGDAFEQRIARRIGMRDFRAESVRRVESSSSVHPAYPFFITTRDLARLGLLFLREGRWKGEQVIPRDWVRESTRAISVPNWGPDFVGGGYGYMWWVEKGGQLFPGTPEIDVHAYAASGFGGQHLIVVPELELVVTSRVYTGSTWHGQAWWYLTGPRLRDSDAVELLQRVIAAAP